MSATLAPCRLPVADLTRLATYGLRRRKLRAALSAMGIAIGVAAVVAVLGLSTSSQAGLLAQIDQLGTNLLTVTNGKTLTGDTAELPTQAPGMIARIGPVTDVEYTGNIDDSHVYRNTYIPTGEHERALRKSHQPRPTGHRRYQRRQRPVPQHRHRVRTSRRARRPRRRAPWH